MFASSAADRPPGRTLRDLIWIALGAALLYLPALGERDLWNPNEPTYGRAVVEMAERGDWTIPHVDDQVFAEKPILYFWGALSASWVRGGIDEFSLRLPCTLAGIASALLTYLLALPYTGRRRALIATALFATHYQVFWIARSAQMDSFVLLATLGCLVPLTRMLDFGLQPSRAWALTGLAAGVGFTAKGPVTLLLPGMVICAYAATEGRLRLLLTRHLALGVVVGLLVAGPWYLALWLNGETGFLFEVLIRQNFMRFVEAWDHQQPWWYYLKYLWIDYLPWAWLLPAAACLGPSQDDEAERSLGRLSWLWIVTIVLFFSLSESKRAPYLVPIAPAVAFLAGSVVDRILRPPISTVARRLALGAWRSSHWSSWRPESCPTPPRSTWPRNYGARWRFWALPSCWPAEHCRRPLRCADAGRPPSFWPPGPRYSSCSGPGHCPRPIT